MTSLMAKLLDKFGPENEEEETRTLSSKMNLALINFRMSNQDGVPARLPPDFPPLYIGSIGCAYNLDNLRASGITHIICLTSSARLCFPSEFKYLRANLCDDGSDEALQQFRTCLDGCFQFIDSALNDNISIPDQPSPSSSSSSSSSSSNSSNNSSRILIHCVQGKSRSAAILIAFLMRTRLKTTILNNTTTTTSVDANTSTNTSTNTNTNTSTDNDNTTTNVSGCSSSSRSLSFDEALAVVRLIRPVAEPNLSFARFLHSNE